MPTFSLDASLQIDDLRTFVCEEFAAQRQKFTEQRALPIEERVEKGTCLSGLRFIRMADSGLVVLRHEGNDSRLREGDLVSLRHANAAENVLASIFREENEEIWLAVEKGLHSSIFQEAEGWFIDEAFIDLERQYLEALERLPSSAIGQERILPLLSGKAEPGFDEDEYNAVQEELALNPTSWEDAQREAIAGCLAADHCYLVQGPPGTGKTRVLAQVVAQLVERGERVLITAFTHRAIDNALSATAREMADRQRVARFGTLTHRRNENYDMFEFFAESPLAEITGGWVAAATPFALKKRLAGVEFDSIVIDEAGQMTTPLAIMAMLTGRKYLLFGDQQQLGPVVVSRSRREAETFGIFHALHAQQKHGTRLDVTYRLNDDLASWPSENFYEGDLASAPGVAARRLQCLISSTAPDWIQSTLDPQSPLVWLQIPHDGARTMNEAEVATSAEILRELSRGGIKAEDMAVVTPYRRQARKLRRRLETLAPGQSWRGCVIDTVERMQGQEREVILLTLCASDPFFIRQQVEFLFDPHRLNVAATRARTKLIILASDHLLDTNLDDTDLEEDQSLLRSLKRCSRILSPPGQD